MRNFRSGRGGLRPTHEAHAKPVSIVAATSASAPGETSDAAGEARNDDAPHYVWYACFGSNILLERFNCYLEGGRIAGMIADMPGWV